MNVSLSIAPVGCPFTVHKAQMLDPIPSKQPDFSFVKKALLCQKPLEAAQLLKTLELPTEATEYHNVHFIKKIENADEKKFELCSVEHMIEQALSLIKLDDAQDEEIVTVTKSKGQKKTCMQDVNSKEETQKTWELHCTSQADKETNSATQELQTEIEALKKELQETGPYLRHRSHFSSLSKQPGIPENTYHCHINDSTPTYVGCWSIEKKTKKITLFYVGTREKAPYAK